MRGKHQTKRIAFESMAANVDAKIASLVLALWKHGFVTTGSCEDNDDEGTVWVQFRTFGDAWRFLQAIRLVVDWFHWQNDRVWEVDDLSPDAHGCVGVRFPAENLGAVRAVIRKAASSRAPSGSASPRTRRLIQSRKGGQS